MIRIDDFHGPKIRVDLLPVFVLFILFGGIVLTLSGVREVRSLYVPGKFPGGMGRGRSTRCLILYREKKKINNFIK